MQKNQGTDALFCFCLPIQYNHSYFKIPNQIFKLDILLAVQYDLCLTGSETSDRFSSQHISCLLLFMFMNALLQCCQRSNKISLAMRKPISRVGDPVRLRPTCSASQTCWSLEISDMSRAMRKHAYCICTNKGADQLHGNPKADKHLGSCYIDRTISSLQPSSSAVQPDLVRNHVDKFSCDMAQI